MNKKIKTLASQCMIVEEEWTNKTLFSPLSKGRSHSLVFPLCCLVRMMKQRHKKFNSFFSCREKQTWTL